MQVIDTEEYYRIEKRQGPGGKDIIEMVRAYRLTGDVNTDVPFWNRPDIQKFLYDATYIISRSLVPQSWKEGPVCNPLMIMWYSEIMDTLRGLGIPTEYAGRVFFFPSEFEIASIIDLMTQGSASPFLPIETVIPFVKGPDPLLATSYFPVVSHVNTRRSRERNHYIFGYMEMAPTVTKYTSLDEHGYYKFSFTYLLTFDDWYEENIHPNLPEGQEIKMFDEKVEMKEDNYWIYGFLRQNFISKLDLIGRHFVMSFFSNHIDIVQNFGKDAFKLVSSRETIHLQYEEKGGSLFSEEFEPVKKIKKVLQEQLPGFQSESKEGDRRIFLTRLLWALVQSQWRLAYDENFRIAMSTLSKKFDTIDQNHHHISALLFETEYRYDESFKVNTDFMINRFISSVENVNGTNRESGHMVFWKNLYNSFKNCTFSWKKEEEVLNNLHPKQNAQECMLLSTLLFRHQFPLSVFGGIPMDKQKKQLFRDSFMPQARYTFYLSEVPGNTISLNDKMFQALLWFRKWPLLSRDEYALKTLLGDIGATKPMVLRGLQYQLKLLKREEDYKDEERRLERLLRMDKLSLSLISVLELFMKK